MPRCGEDKISGKDGLSTYTWGVAEERTGCDRHRIEKQDVLVL